MAPVTGPAPEIPRLGDVSHPFFQESQMEASFGMLAIADLLVEKAGLVHIALFSLEDRQVKASLQIALATSFSVKCLSAGEVSPHLIQDGQAKTPIGMPPTAGLLIEVLCPGDIPLEFLEVAQVVAPPDGLAIAGPFIQRLRLGNIAGPLGPSPPRENSPASPGHHKTF